MMVSISLIIVLWCGSALGAAWPVLQKGSNGVNVTTLQDLLAFRGYYVSADGIFGSRTDSAVRSFQFNSGLIVDGVVGSNTWSGLMATVKRGAAGYAVKSVQYQLNKKYGFNISVDGIFGYETDTAVKIFQNRNGLVADGIVGAATWQALLGESVSSGVNNTGSFWDIRQSSWIHPLKGGTTIDPASGGRQFGAARDSGSRLHAGVDFIAPAGRPVLAMTDGQVVRISEFYQGTKAVEVKNTDGTVVRYCEIAPSVSVGSKVYKGEQIGTVMRSYTGSQMLHLEVYRGTASGSLTQSNAGNYYYVPAGNYQRRADLQDPMGAASLRIVY